MLKQRLESRGVLGQPLPQGCFMLLFQRAVMVRPQTQREPAVQTLHLNLYPVLRHSAHQQLTHNICGAQAVVLVTELIACCKQGIEQDRNVFIKRGFF